MSYRNAIYIVGGMTQSGSTKLYASLLYYLQKYKNPNTLGFHDSELAWSPLDTEHKIKWSKQDSDSVKWRKEQEIKLTKITKYLNTAPIVIKCHDWMEDSKFAVLLQRVENVKYVFIRCVRDIRDAVCSRLRKTKTNDDIERIVKTQNDLYHKWTSELITKNLEMVKKHRNWNDFVCYYYSVRYEDYTNNDILFAKKICEIANLPCEPEVEEKDSIYEEIVKFFNNLMINKSGYLMSDKHVTNGGKVGGYKDYLTSEDLSMINKTCENLLTEERYEF